MSTWLFFNNHFIFPDSSTLVVLGVFSSVVPHPQSSCSHSYLMDKSTSEWSRNSSSQSRSLPHSCAFDSSLLPKTPLSKIRPQISQTHPSRIHALEWSCSNCSSSKIVALCQDQTSRCYPSLMGLSNGLEWCPTHCQIQLDPTKECPTQPAIPHLGLHALLPMVF